MHAVARALAKAGWPVVPAGDPQSRPYGRRARIRRRHFAPPATNRPPIAEFSTLTYVARKYSPDTVTISPAGRNRFASLPCPAANQRSPRHPELFPDAIVMGDVLATGLANVNMVLHPPGAVLAAAWVEATHGTFTFYVEG